MNIFCMYVQLVPIRERCTFTGYIFCISVCFTIHNLGSSDLQFPTAHSEVLKWLQKLCAPTALLLYCLSPGESGMAGSRLWSMEELPTVCLISLISLWRDLPQTDQGLSGFMVIPQEMLWYAALLTHQPEASQKVDCGISSSRAQFT